MGVVTQPPHQPRTRLWAPRRRQKSGPQDLQRSLRLLASALRGPGDNCLSSLGEYYDNASPHSQLAISSLSQLVASHLSPTRNLTSKLGNWRSALAPPHLGQVMTLAPHLATTQRGGQASMRSRLCRCHLLQVSSTEDGTIGQLQETGSHTQKLN